MMGIQELDGGKFFYTNISIAQRVRRDHPLRKIAARVDFDFIYREVADKYGTRGNVLVPPPVDTEADASFGLLQRPIRA